MSGDSLSRYGIVGKGWVSTEDNVSIIIDELTAELWSSRSMGNGPPFLCLFIKILSIFVMFSLLVTLKEILDPIRDFATIRVLNTKA
jgi:hypothetical protein